MTTDFAGREEDDPFFTESIILVAGLFGISVVAGLMGGAAVALAIAWVPLLVYGLFIAPVNVSAPGAVVRPVLPTKSVPESITVPPV